MPAAHLDYEGRSRADLPSVGAHRYAIDPSTEVLMAGVSRDGDPRVFLWINPKFRTPDELGENEEAERILAEADTIYAHNAPFEQAMTWGTLQRRAVSPFKAEPPIEKWRCSAAVARKAGLPHSLDKLCAVLNVKDSKDRAGKALIQWFCIPDEDTGQFREPRDHPEKWAAFCAYCRQDVRAETECGAKLKAFELTGDALATFQFDLRMNQRGIPINLGAAQNAQKIIDEVQGGVREEFRRLTGYNVTQRAKVLAWFNDTLKLDLPNTQAETIEAKIADLEMTLQEDGLMGAADPEQLEAQRILKMYQSVSYAAVKKIRTMLDCICPDGRIRGTFMYYGAIRTGRWSGKLLQPQNFRKVDEEFKDIVGPAYRAICAGIGAHLLDQLYGPPLEVIANLIRSFIHHEHELLDGDYNAIEGRFGCWIAGQNDILEDWRNGKDLYKRAVAFVEGIDENNVTKTQRGFGKVVELACQFGLGTEGFMRTCDAWGIPCDEGKAKKAVHEYYRPTHPKIVARWYQHDSWIRDAIAYPTTQQGPWICRKVAGMMYLLLKLPSGRSLAYPDPQINKRKATRKEVAQMLADHLSEDRLALVLKQHSAEGALELWAEQAYGVEGLGLMLVKRFTAKRFLEITFWGNIQGATWGRQKLHGALAFENEVQATAGDFMAYGAIQAERLGMPPFMLVHDQGVALRDRGQTADQFAAALASLPPWAKGFPMKVEAKVTEFFTK